MTKLPVGALVVSCQARPDNPLHGPVYMAAMAEAAVAGGAAAIRANGGGDIAAIRAVVAVPIIGLVKRYAAAPGITITPDLAAIAEAAADADIVAIDATARPRPAAPLTDLVAAAKAAGRLVLADVATLDEGRAAADIGADYVATTLSGYTTADAPPPEPDIDLVAQLTARLPVPVVAEGRYATPQHIRAAFSAGAHAVVVGTAVTNPRDITRRLAAAIP